MNPQLASDLATCHARDLKRLADDRRKHSGHRESSAANDRRFASPLRRRIGFTLIAAGLHLLAGSAD